MYICAHLRAFFGILPSVLSVVALATCPAIALAKAEDGSFMRRRPTRQRSTRPAVLSVVALAKMEASCEGGIN